MYAFVADQVFGLNGLVNFSNIVFLAAYSVRTVLTLRILAIVGEGMTLPYYYYQDEKLWLPIYWGAAFRQRGPHRGDGIGAAAGRFQ